MIDNLELDPAALREPVEDGSPTRLGDIRHGVHPRVRDEVGGGHGVSWR